MNITTSERFIFSKPSVFSAGFSFSAELLPELRATGLAAGFAFVCFADAALTELASLIDTGWRPFLSSKRRASVRSVASMSPVLTLPLLLRAL